MNSTAGRSQFRSRAYRAAPGRHGPVGSVGQVASAPDNAAMESWFSLLQENVLNQRKVWATHARVSGVPVSISS